MRLLVLPLLLLGVASSDASRPEPPHPYVILVHGRGQSGSDSATVRREWKRELDAALRSVGFAALRDEDVALAWYADVVDPAAASSCDRPRYGTESDAGEFARGFLVSLAAVMPDSGREEEQQVRSLLGDVLYLVDPATRCAAEMRLGHVVRAARSAGRPVIVVAYSLGAVVAYDYLSRATDSLAVHLITVGAPLGVPIVRELLTGTVDELRVPRSVSRWVNIYDPDDAFAAPLQMRAAAVIDRPLKSRTSGDPHRAGRYFRAEETGAALAGALCAIARDRYTECVTRMDSASIHAPIRR